MAKRRINQRFRLDEKNLSRFGCSFEAATRVFWIDWRGRTAKQASESRILARLCAVETESGPVVALAFEISPVRPLPHYFYFPFNLGNRVHREYLVRFTQSGLVKLRFYIGKQSTDRVHQLSPYLLSRATGIYNEAIRRYEKLGPKAYDWGTCLRVLETWVRIPELLEHSLLEDNFPEVRRRIEEAVKLVPSERRDLAGHIVRQAMEVFKSQDLNNERLISENTLLIRSGLLYLTDLQSLLAGNSEVAECFFADGIAATFSETELRSLGECLKVVASLFGSFRSTPGQEPNRSRQLSPPAEETAKALEPTAIKPFISLNSLKSLADLLGFEVRGVPGRPARDYSLEYNWKTNMSWTDVARKALSEDPEFREEFSGRSFDSLDFAQQEALKHRIREGVKSHTKRIGLPPPPRVSK